MSNFKDRRVALVPQGTIAALVFNLDYDIQVYRTWLHQIRQRGVLVVVLPTARSHREEYDLAFSSQVITSLAREMGLRVTTEKKLARKKIFNVEHLNKKTALEGPKTIVTPFDCLRVEGNTLTVMVNGPIRENILEQIS